MENISLFIDDDLTRDEVNSLEKKFPSAELFNTIATRCSHDKESNN